MKHCPGCSRDLPNTSFSTNAAKKDGLSYKCRTCMAEKQRLYRLANIDKARERDRKSCAENRATRSAASRGWYARNKDYMAAKRAANPARQASATRKWKYGTDGLDLMKEQKGLCAICCVELLPGRGVGAGHLDHDHATGKVRGWLCRGCNHGLGHFRDNKKLLLEAVNYLFTRCEPGSAKLKVAA